MIPSRLRLLAGAAVLLSLSGCGEEALRKESDTLRQAEQADHNAQEKAIAELRAGGSDFGRRIAEASEQSVVRTESLTKRLDGVAQRLDEQVTRLEKADAALSARTDKLAKAIDDLNAGLARLDQDGRQRLDSAVAAVRKDGAQSADALAAQLKTEVDGVRSACAGMITDMRAIAGSFRTAAHRQHEALAEQLQSTTALVAFCDRTIGEKDQATPGERATTLFGQAAELYRTALAAKDVDGLAKAAELYRTGLELDPARTTAHYNLASLYLALDNTGEAIPQLERVLALEPNGAMAPAAKQALEAARGAKP